MFFGPAKALLKVMSRVMEVENAVVVTEVAPIEHWLFSRISDELTDLIWAPMTLSHSSWMDPRFRSYTTKQESSATSAVPKRIAAADRLAELWVSEKTNVKAWVKPLPLLGDTESTAGTGGLTTSTV